MKSPKQIKVTLRLNEPDYEYLRRMAESKFDYGGLNLIIREVLHSFVENTKKLVAQKQAEQTQTRGVQAQNERPDSQLAAE